MRSLACLYHNYIIKESLSITQTVNVRFKLSSEKKVKTVLMDKKLRETTNLCVEIMNSKRQVKGNFVTWYKSRLPFDVNVMLNLSIIKQIKTRYLDAIFKKTNVHNTKCAQGSILD